MARAAVKKGNGLILKIILIIAILYAVGMLVSLQVRTEAARAEVESLQKELDLQMRKNSEATEMVDSDINDEYVIKIAREKLGYILPGERIFEDSQSTK